LRDPGSGSPLGCNEDVFKIIRVVLIEFRLCGKVLAEGFPAIRECPVILALSPEGIICLHFEPDGAHLLRCRHVAVQVALPWSIFTGTHTPVFYRSKIVQFNSR